MPEDEDRPSGSEVPPVDGQQFATAYALSTSVGLRAFMTLALAAIAVHFGYLHPSAQFSWLGSDGVVYTLLGLAALEFFADKIPAVDHLLHSISFATKPIVAALLVGSAVPEGTPDGLLYTAMIAGGANALGVHTASATARAASSAMTFGLGNPVLSVIEDGIALAGVAISFFLPILGAFIAIALTVFLIWLARRTWVYLRSKRETIPVS
jgi:hypothetical protein